MVSEKEGELSEIRTRFNTLPQGERINLLFALLKDTGLAHGLARHPDQEEKLCLIPIGVFSTGKLSALEAIVKYLKEVQHYRLAAIGRLLNRHVKSIWTTYNAAFKKMPEPYGALNEEILIPAGLFRDRSLSVFEHIVVFLKRLDFTNHAIALMLRRDDRTIWSVYDNAKQKLQRKHGE